MGRPKLKNKPNYISKSVQFTEKDWKKIERHMRKHKVKQFAALARSCIVARMAVMDSKEERTKGDSNGI